jgi:hypothetical protein
MAMFGRSILKHVLRTATALAVLVGALMPPTRLSKLESVCSGSGSVRHDVRSSSTRVSVATFSPRSSRVKAVRSESEEELCETARPTSCPIDIPPVVPPKPERDLATPGLDRATYPLRC